MILYLSFQLYQRSVTVILTSSDQRSVTVMFVTPLTSSDQGSVTVMFVCSVTVMFVTAFNLF